MIALFSRLADAQHLVGSPAYLQNIQRMFAQDESGGMIEVLLPGGERWIYLYISGRLLAAYRLIGPEHHPLATDEMAHLAVQELEFRYLNLPDQAVRAVWQALEWLPPKRGARMDANALASYLDVLRQDKASGLVQITLADLDGFLLLENGAWISSETVLASGRGFLDKLPNLSTLAGSQSGSCELWLLEPASGSLTAHLMELRIAFAAWTTGAVTDYQMLVGSNLITPLNNSVNTWLRHRRLNIRLVGATVVDHHLFADLDTARRSYAHIKSFLQEHLAQVVGDQLAQKTINESARRLKAGYQHVLAENGLKASGA
jgi:hypothetical protein